MNKHKHYALTWGPIPREQPAVSEADVSWQIHSIISQSERRLDMGFSARMRLKGDVYAREILHATARKIAFGEKPSPSYVLWIYKNEILTWTEEVASSVDVPALHFQWW